MRLFCPSCGRPTRDVDEADRVARCGTCGDFAYAPPSADPPPAGDRAPPADLVLDDEPAVPLPAGFVDDGRTVAWRPGDPAKAVEAAVMAAAVTPLAGGLFVAGGFILRRVVIDGEWSALPFCLAWCAVTAAVTGLSALAAYAEWRAVISRPRLTLEPDRATIETGRRRATADAGTAALYLARPSFGRRNEAVDLLARDAAGRTTILVRRLPSREAGRYLLQRIERHLGLPPRRVPGGLR